MTNCVVCGCKSLRFAYRGGAVRDAWKGGGEWTVVHCASCGHRFIEPYPAEEVLARHYAVEYDAYRFGHGQSANFTEIVTVAKTSGRHRHVEVHPGMHLLDVGCGSGSFLAVCREMGAEVQGVEPSKDGIATCLANGVPAFHGGMAAFLEANTAKYDLVTANHVLEHHPNPVTLLRQMRSVLRPGGSVWVSVPNAGSFLAKALKADWHSADLPVHLQHFSTDSLSHAFRAAGLTVTSLRTESENSLPGSVAHLLRGRMMVPRRVTLSVLGRSLRKDGWFGRRIDTAGQGEAILVAAV